MFMNCFGGENDQEESLAAENYQKNEIAFVNQMKEKMAAPGEYYDNVHPSFKHLDTVKKAAEEAVTQAPREFSFTHAGLATAIGLLTENISRFVVANSEQDSDDRAAYLQSIYRGLFNMESRLEEANTKAHALVDELYGRIKSLQEMNEAQRTGMDNILFVNDSDNPGVIDKTTIVKGDPVYVQNALMIGIAHLEKEKTLEREQLAAAKKQEEARQKRREQDKARRARKKAPARKKTVLPSSAAEAAKGFQKVSKVVKAAGYSAKPAKPKK